MVDYYCGLDLGQAQDYSALVIAERQQPARHALLPRHLPRPQAHYDVRYIKRW